MADQAHGAENDVVRTLVAERSQSGMSMRAVARLADVSPSCVHSWEHGTKEPSLNNLRAWAEALGYRLTLTRILPPAAPECPSGCGRNAPCPDPWHDQRPIPPAERNPS